MAESMHPAAPHHLPFFITPRGETDVLMVVLAFILAVSVFGFGVFFFRLHSLPEHIAHKGKKMQAELVAVLCLVSLFTHMHIFWIVALVLAMLELPDFSSPLNRIAGSAEKMAGFKPGEGDIELPPRYAADSHAVAHGHAEPGPPSPVPDSVGEADAIPLPARAEAAKYRERAHA
jgi:hypothetical protein